LGPVRATVENRRAGSVRVLLVFSEALSR